MFYDFVLDRNSIIKQIKKICNFALLAYVRESNYVFKNFIVSYFHIMFRTNANNGF